MAYDPAFMAAHYAAQQASVSASSPRVEPEQAVEGRADCPPSGPPAEKPKPRPFQSQCKRCREYHERMGDLCYGCAADDRDVCGLQGAYWELRLLLGYVSLLNDCPEGRVYLALVEHGVHDALVYGRKIEALRAVA